MLNIVAAFAFGLVMGGGAGALLAIRIFKNIWRARLVGLQGEMMGMQPQGGNAHLAAGDPRRMGG